MKIILIILGLFIYYQTSAQSLSPKEKQEIINQLKEEILDSLSNKSVALFDNTDNETPKLNHQKGEPFEGIDMTWQNGSDRRTNNIWKDLKYFTPSILLDINYTHSFNNPNDNTVVGSTALTRNNEVQLSALHFGGDFNYNGARARVMTQFGTRSQVVPRNDFSPYRGQYQLANVYRYLSEAYAGYHIKKWYGFTLTQVFLCRT